MSKAKAGLLQGTLDMLILKALFLGPLHGYGIGQRIAQISGDELKIEEGSLYPALQRMQVKGWIASESKKTPTGREARYYKLTTAGRKQLGQEEADFKRSIAATVRVLKLSDA